MSLAGYAHGNKEKEGCVIIAQINTWALDSNTYNKTNAITE